MKHAAYKNRQEYIDLMSRYDYGEIDTPTFSNNYLIIWKRDRDVNEKKDQDTLWFGIPNQSDNLFLQLKSSLFSDIDSWVPDDQYDPKDPYEISESELKKRVKSYLNMLKKHKGEW